jgi:hypothetical protein
MTESIRGADERTTPPMQNRVTPRGEIVAIALRGSWLGNRGRLHEGTEIRRHHASNLWIVCRLEFRGRSIPQWAPHHYTVLFFHDEAVALAAGHRPCAYCRGDDYNAYRAAWATGLVADLPSAATIDRQLQGERIVRGTHQRQYHDLDWSEVPVGSFVLQEGRPMLSLERCLVPWCENGYSSAIPRPAAGAATLLTPPSTVAALRAGYRVQIDDSALAQQLVAQ